jgi:nicotinamidase-related amidase
MNEDCTATPTAPFRDSPRGGTALLIVDMISEMDFPGLEEMAGQLDSITQAIVRLREEADRAGVPTIYVNDNFGEWHSERSRLLQRALAGGGRGAEVARRLEPRDDDYFIIKPQFSGFYATNLPVLLPKLGVDKLILTGIATDICILFTAADAHMRDYELWVPADATATPATERKHWALRILAATMGAETTESDRLPLASWVHTD